MKQNVEVKQVCNKFIIKGYVHTIPNSLLRRHRKSDWIRLLFTHKNGNFGAISVKERSCAKTISKVESDITDEVLYHTLVQSVHLLGPSRK